MRKMRKMRNCAQLIFLRGRCSNLRLQENLLRWKPYWKLVCAPRRWYRAAWRPAHHPRWLISPPPSLEAWPVCRYKCGTVGYIHLVQRCTRSPEPADSWLHEYTHSLLSPETPPPWVYTEISKAAERTIWKRGLYLLYQRITDTGMGRKNATEYH